MHTCQEKLGHIALSYGHCSKLIPVQEEPLDGAMKQT